MPPDVKKMSDRYKEEMCSCITCLKKQIYQESLVRFRKGVLQQLKRANDRAKHGSSTRRRIEYQVQNYETEINVQETVHETEIRVYCKMQSNLDGPYFDGLHHISFAYGWCSNCHVYKLHKTEQQLINQNNLPSSRSIYVQEYLPMF